MNKAYNRASMEPVSGVRVRHHFLLLSCAALAACSSVPVHRTLVGGEFKHLQQGAPVAELTQGPVNHCRPSQKVIVVDAAGKPVKGATLVASQRVSEHAIEETLAVYNYAAAPIATDARGQAWVCAPASLAPRPAFEGIGGGFSVRDNGRILVSSGTAVAEVQPPFPAEVRVTLGQPAQ